LEAKNNQFIRCLNATIRCVKHIVQLRRSLYINALRKVPGMPFTLSMHCPIRVHSKAQND